MPVTGNTNVVHFVRLPSFTRTVPLAATFLAFVLGCEMMKERIIINCNVNVEYKQKQQHKIFLFRIYYHIFSFASAAAGCLHYSNLPASLLHSEYTHVNNIHKYFAHTFTPAMHSPSSKHTPRNRWLFNCIYSLEVENGQLTDSIFKCLSCVFPSQPFSKLWLYDQLTHRPAKLLFASEIFGTSLMATVNSKMPLMRFGGNKRHQGKVA